MEDDRPDPEADHVPTAGGMFSFMIASVVMLALYLVTFYRVCR